MILTFKYLNHRGETADRTIEVDAIEWLSDPPREYYPQPGWFISGFDLLKQARRTFSLQRIQFDHKKDFKLLMLQSMAQE